MSFVTTHRDRFGVEPILRVLDIPVSTFYGWLARRHDPCQHQRQEQRRCPGDHRKATAKQGMGRIRDVYFGQVVWKWVLEGGIKTRDRSTALITPYYSKR